MSFHNSAPEPTHPILTTLVLAPDSFLFQTPSPRWSSECIHTSGENIHGIGKSGISSSPIPRMDNSPKESNFERGRRKAPLHNTSQNGGFFGNGQRAVACLICLLSGIILLGVSDSILPQGSKLGPSFTMSSQHRSNCGAISAKPFRNWKQQGHMGQHRAEIDRNWSKFDSRYPELPRLI